MTKFRRKGAACGLGWTILISTLVPLSFAQTQVPPALPTSTSDASTSSRPIGPMAFFINTSAYVVVQDDLLKPNYQEKHFGFRWGNIMAYACTNLIWFSNNELLPCVCTNPPSNANQRRAPHGKRGHVVAHFRFFFFFKVTCWQKQQKAFHSSTLCACNHHFEITVRVHLFEAESSSYVWKSHLHFQIIWFCKSSRKKMNIIHHTYTFHSLWVPCNPAQVHHFCLRNSRAPID